MTDTFREFTGATTHCVIDRRSIEAAEKRIVAEGGRAVLADTVAPGLRLVIGARSARWTYAYRARGAGLDGKRPPQRTLTIGDLSSMSPAAARLRVGELKAAIRRGEDPATDLRAAAELAKLELHRTKTVRALAAEYIASELEPRAGEKSSRNPQYLKNEASGLLLGIGEMRCNDVTPDHITLAMVADLARLHRSTPATARHRLGTLSRFFQWMVTREIVPGDLTQKLSRKDRPDPVPKRDRLISAAELKAVWDAAERLSDARRDFIRTALCVPLRRGELSELRAGDVDLDGGLIRLPASATKNKKPFEIAIPAKALPILKVRCDGLEPSARVFQLSSAGTSMSAWSQLLAGIRRYSGVTFGLHDTRRTFSSRLGEIGAGDIWLIDAMLNHQAASTRTGVIANYQHAKQSEARRLVMEAWNRQLEHAIAHGVWPCADDRGNVVAMRKGARDGAATA